MTERALEELRRELATVPVGRPQITREHVIAAKSLVGADVFGYFTFDAAGTLDAFAFSGMSAAATADYRRVVRADRTWGFFEPWQVPQRQQNRLVLFQTRQFLDGDPGTLRRLGMPRAHYQHVVDGFREHSYPFYVRHCFDAVWQLRIVLTLGSRLIGWFGGLFEQRPSRTQAAALAALAPTLVARAHHARRLAMGASGETLIENLLELQRGACYLVSSSGDVLHANRAGRDGLARGSTVRDHIRAAVATPRRAPGYQAIAVDAARGLYVVCAEVTEAVPDLSRMGLTRRQADVARALLGGASNREIARTLEMSERTVEVHLTAIYKRLGVEGRTAAIATLFGAPQGETRSLPRAVHTPPRVTKIS